MNHRLIGKYIGYLLLAEAVFLLPSALVGLIYGEHEPMLALLVSAAACAVAGGLLFLLCRTAKGNIYPRESFVVAGLGWVLISVFGSFPFLISGQIPSFADALFETVSGFTTTGATILTDIEAMSKCLLFWRSFTHWLGGIGVLAFLLAILRSQDGSGFSLHLLRAESPGPQVGKMMPKMRQNVRSLYAIYFVLSALNLAFLLFGGMPLFDALCTMFGTAGTGGYGIKTDSLASYSLYLQGVTTVFMLLFGINFSLYYFAFFRREWKAAAKDEELRLYLGLFVGASLGITATLMLNNAKGFFTNLHNAFFTASSVMTTTGYTTVDFDHWPQFAQAILLLLMVVGAMAGSTGGGFKVSRLLILIKDARAGMHKLLHPRSVKTVRINGKTISDEVVRGTYLFLAVYMAIVFVSFLLVSVDGMPLETNLSAVLSCFNNIGPDFGIVYLSDNYVLYSVFSKLVLTINMLLGRLEIFPILLLMLPSTWRRKT